jgi:hypothetical protein
MKVNGVVLKSIKDCPDYTTKIPAGTFGCIPGKKYEFCINPDSHYIGCEANRQEGKCPRNITSGD